MPVNDDIVDASILHAHYLERVKNGQAKAAIEYLNTQVFPEVTKELISALRKIGTGSPTVSPQKLEKLLKLYAEINQIINDGMLGLKNDVVLPDLKDLGILQAKWQIKKIAALLPNEITKSGISFSLPQPSTIGRAISQVPYQGATLNQWWQELNANFKGSLSKAVTDGFIRGESTAAITRRVTGTTSFPGVYGQTRRQIEAQVKTAINHTIAQSDQQLYEQNSSLIEGVQWVSTLDSRTSLICIELDGQIFGIGEGPRPPAHFGCRSRTVPVLKSFKAFGLKDPLISTRASMNGQVSEKMTYGKWLKKQTAETQREVLGKTRYDLWKSGKVDINGFVNNHSQILTVKALKEKYDIK